MAAAPEHDVIVIGSGSGGLVAAGQLALAGVPPLVLETSERLGGRFSTIDKDGFRLPTGAIAIETAGPFFETFGELGIEPDLIMPDPPVLIRVKGRDLRPGAPVWEHMIKRVTKAAGRVAEGIAENRSEDLEEDITLEQWARRYTRSKTVAGLFQSLSSAIFTVNADELPARAFFRHLRETGAYKRYGYAARGNVQLADAIADAVRARGGQVRTGWTATAIELDSDGRAAAVHATDPDGASRRLAARAILSNAGPLNTAAMLAGTPVEAAFRKRTSGLVPTSMMALAFSTDHEILGGFPGLMNFLDTKRVCNIANLAPTCPELAPPGRTLYEAYACPRPSRGGGHDVEAERALMEEDLRRLVPGFDDAQIVLFKNMAGRSSPAQHAAPGEDLDIRTPVANLLEVGDGVKPYGWIGTTACAHTARTAVATLLQELDLRGGLRPVAIAGR